MASKEMPKDQIAVLVKRKVDEATGVANSRLSKERQRVLRHYNGELPAQQKPGSASYVSTDVFDAVESMKADLLETFGGSQDIGKFAPQNAKDVEPSRIATEFCSYIIYRKNDGYSIFHDVIDDGLKARVGVVKMYYHKDEQHQEEEFGPLDEHEVEALASQHDVTELEAEYNEEGAGYHGSLKRLVFDNSGVVIDPVAPEEFGIEPQAKSLSDAFHYHVTVKTKDELRDEGFNTKLLKDAQPDASEVPDNATETDYRHSGTDNGYRRNDADHGDRDPRFRVYECYFRFTKDPKKGRRLYKVVLVAGIVLDCEEVNRSPFKVFTPLRVGHSFYGNNFAARVIPTQNARTTLTRGILDHTSVTINPRYTVLQAGLTNPREMLDNRLGGLVNITRPDAVQPLMQAPLNPFVYQTLEMLKQNKEETTGTSSLSQGLNKDAISQQNSQGMVSDLVNLSKQRAKIAARNFASFLREVYIEAYTLTLENQDRQSVFEVAGNWEEIDPRTWIQRKDFSIQFFLGQGAADAEAMKVSSMIAMAAQDEFLSRSLGEKGRYNAAKRIADIRGMKYFPELFTAPEQTPPPGPNPEHEIAMAEMKLKQSEMQFKLQEMQMKLVEAQEKNKGVVLKAQAEQAKAAAEQQNVGLENELKIADSHRKDMDIANKIDIAQREIQIIEAAPPPTEGATAIASPNS